MKKKAEVFGSVFIPFTREEFFEFMELVKMDTSSVGKTKAGYVKFLLKMHYIDAKFHYEKQKNTD